tara:strand:- start:6809 stop:7162 length:354 start_codon:yes stop_codon:yes gene_type:complete
MSDITKESTLEVLKEVPEVLRALVEENTKLASIVDEYRKQEKAEEIVSMMDARGFSDKTTPFKDKVAALLASKKDLEVVKEALALQSPDLSFASISEVPSEGNGDATQAFEKFLLGD